MEYKIVFGGKRKFFPSVPTTRVSMEGRGEAEGPKWREEGAGGRRGGRVEGEEGWEGRRKEVDRREEGGRREGRREGGEEGEGPGMTEEGGRDGGPEEGDEGEGRGENILIILQTFSGLVGSNKET
jgi:hypothetical protein